MEKLKKILFLSLFAFLSLQCKAQIYDVVFDPKTTAQIFTNMFWQLSIEQPLNNTLDTTLSWQNQIMEKSVALSGYKELHKKSLQNTSGFEEESIYYKDIAKTAMDILELTPKVVEEVNKSKFINKIICLNKVADLGMKCTQCVNDFVNIVNNGKVSNPLANTSFANGIENKNDGANIMDRLERINLASQISLDLKSVKKQLNTILFYCTYGDWGDLIYEIDPKTSSSLENGKTISDNLIQRWKNLKY